jgi:hypothetical protein
MAMFFDWLVFRDTATLLRLRLLESAEWFNPSDYNQIFDGQLEKLIHRLPDGEARQQAMTLRGFDWANYIVRSLQRSGFKDDDIQEHFHQIVIKLLVEPGRLFKGWEPQRHGPLDRRHRRSIWNLIRNIVQKRQNQRKWMTAVDPVAMADRFAGRAPYSDLIDQFRNLVAQRLGKLALEILDARLAGEDSKKLVGKAANGTASAYYIRRETSALKRLAYEFAQQTGDPAFLRLVDQAFSAQAATVKKRQQATAARQAQ